MYKVPDVGVVSINFNTRSNLRRLLPPIPEDRIPLVGTGLLAP
jgi:hypothetical protein